MNDVAPSLLAEWWGQLVRPERAGRWLQEEHRPDVDRFLALLILGLYGAYGVSMGLFTGAGPGGVSALKLPLMFTLTQAVCFPAFYVINCRIGPAFRPWQCRRVLLLAASANAAAVASYAPLSYFFALTTSATDGGYAFLVFMHIAVFGIAGLLSVGLVAWLFRAAAFLRGRPMRAVTVWLWGLLYGVVGAEMSWAMRPWIGWPGEPYQFFKGTHGSFLESLLRVVEIVF